MRASEVLDSMRNERARQQRRSNGRGDAAVRLVTWGWGMKDGWWTMAIGANETSRVCLSLAQFSDASDRLQSKPFAWFFELLRFKGVTLAAPSPGPAPVRTKRAWL